LAKVRLVVSVTTVRLSASARAAHRPPRDAHALVPNPVDRHPKEAHPFPNPKA
jgi:hypothetical protein